MKLMLPVLSVVLCGLSGITFAAPPTSRVVSRHDLELRPNDTICLVGNELGERLQHHNWFETLLYQNTAAQPLTVRNLCFPGDEPQERIRSLDFGTPDAHLTYSKATVVIFFFGFNESFDGDDGLADFRSRMHDLVQHTLQQKYDGQSAPRVALVSPIACEDTGDTNLPKADDRNKLLQQYTHVLRDVATSTNVVFADVFTPTRQLFESTETRLTLNGAHLNDAGYQALAPILMQALGLPFNESAPFHHRLKAEIDDKNFHWWHRYRAVNGYSIYGKRGLAGSDGTYNNRQVMEREREILDEMTANRDRRILALVQGQDVPEVCDDSNTLPFYDVKTNVGGEDDPNRKRGTLGTLDYLPAADQQKLFKLAPGYEIQLVASEEDFPELANPVALNFDNRGRLWVTTMPSYPHWKPKTRLEDKVLILTDDNSDGRADRCTVFADGLHQPTGFELGRGGVWVAQQPDILFLQDTDGDDRADVKIRKLVGFDTADSHHGLAAFEWGPGGALYVNEGTFKYSQVESPWGLTRMHEAGVWRYEPTTERFGTHMSFAFANPWGHVYDRWGQDFVSDASSGFNYWAAPFTGRVDYPSKHAGGVFNDTVNNFDNPDLRGREIGKRFIVKRTRPSAGNEIVSSRHFKPEDQGDFLLCNVIGDRSILQHSVSEVDSGFEGTEKTPLVYCEDGNFRPIDIQFAPDGTLYICDWHNALIGHLQHNLREPNRDHQHGRIWRVLCTGRDLVTPPPIAGESVATVLNALLAPEDRARYRARRELAERPSRDVVPAVKTWIASRNQADPDYAHQLLEANWVLQSHNIVDEALLTAALTSDDYRCRAAATRILSYQHHQLSDPGALLAERIADDHPRVRLEAVRACSFLQGDEAIELALEVLNGDMDEYLQYTLDETMRHLEGE